MNLRNFTAAFILLLAGLFTMTSCGKDDEEIRVQVTNNITQGTWRITNFDDDGDEKKDLFDGYSFTFASNGTLTATKTGAATQTGTWSITDGDENNDILDDLDFNINFPGAIEPFVSMNDDWDIVAFDSDELDLSEVAGPLDTDLLSFQKN